MRVEDLHDEFCSALQGCGGESPEKHLPTNYSGSKADALFLPERTIVEVKSLCTDRVEAAEVEGVVERLFGEWQSNGGPIPFGRVSFEVAEVAEPYRSELLDFYGKRVKRELGNANRQIRETASALGWTESFGLVVFLTPASFRAHVGVISHAQWAVLQHSDRAPFVHGLMNFAVPVEDHGDQAPQDMWAVPHPRPGFSFPRGLPRRIADAWGNHFASKVGVNLRPVEGTAEAFFEKF
jgi:hypothetical protein